MIKLYEQPEVPGRHGMSVHGTWQSSAGIEASSDLVFYVAMLGYFPHVKGRCIFEMRT